VSDDESRLDELERLVGLAYRELDAAPDDVVDKAAGYLRWRAEGTIAFIVDARDEELVAVRGPVGLEPAQRFRSGEHLVEVTIEDVSIVGSIEPWTGGRAAIETPAVVAPIPIDDDGWFQVDRPASTRARLRFETSEGLTITTSWFRVSLDRSS
jgi:hypothetical protein